MSCRLTAKTLRSPSSGLICASIRLRSVASVLSFLLAPRRVKSRPCAASPDNIAKVGNISCATLFKFLSGGIPTFGDLGKKTSSFVARRVRSPWRSVATNSVPALTSLFRPIFQSIEHRRTLSPASTKPWNASVPKRTIFTKITDIFDPKPAGSRHRPRRFSEKRWQPHGYPTAARDIVTTAQTISIESR